MSASFFTKMTKKLTNMFGDAHSNYVINRRSNDDLVSYTIPIKRGPKEQVLGYLNNNVKTYSNKLPLLGFTLESMDPSEERKINPLTKILSGDNSSYIFSPTPFDFIFSLGIYASNESDLYDIVEQIVALYRDTRYYPLKEFQFTDGSVLTRDIPIRMQSTIKNIPEEISQGDMRVLQYNLDFAVKGYVYGPIKGVDTTDNINWRDNNTITYEGGNIAKLIEHIDLRFEEFNERYYEELSLDIDTGSEIVCS